MLCPKCGTSVGDSLRLCDNCAASSPQVPVPESTTVGNVELRAGQDPQSIQFPDDDEDQEYWVPMEGEDYAGFWLRLIAGVVDFCISSLIALGVLIQILPVVLRLVEVDIKLGKNSYLLTALLNGEFFVYALGGIILENLFVTWFYFAIRESSEFGDTPGKMLMGLSVIDTKGGSLSFWRASLRHFAKYFSFMPLGIGFIISAFSPKKQALHDVIAGSLVIRRKSHPYWLVILGTSLAIVLIGSIILMQLLIFGNKDFKVPSYLQIDPMSIFYVMLVLVFIGGICLQIYVAFKGDTMPVEEKARLRKKGLLLILVPTLLFIIIAVLRHFLSDDDKKGPDKNYASNAGSGDNGMFSSGSSTGEDPVDLSKIGREIVYDMRKVKSTIALWNDVDGELMIGFYSMTLTDDDLRTIRKEKSLAAVSEKRPDVYLTFMVNSTERYVSVERVKSYSVSFSKFGGAGFKLPNDEAKVEFNYNMMVRAAEGMSSLKGELADRKYITGTLRNSGTKPVEGGEFRFRWDLQFLTEVLVVHGRARESLLEKGENLPTGVLARVSTGELSFDFTNSIALYFSSGADVAIGFYKEALSDSERQEIRNKKSLSVFVNNKRPNLVLFLDFKPASSSVSTQYLSGYTVYLYRDKLGGSFTFPGTQDSLSFKRADEQMELAEFGKLTGTLGANGTVNIEMDAEGAPSGRSDRFSWHIRASVPLSEVK